MVAAEVRSLALRTSTAAKEIKSLIQDSQSKVDKGRELVDRSGQTLAGVVTSVISLGDIFSQIVRASEEQSSGIEQIDVAMGQIDQVTQSSSSKTEELAATAQTLADQSSQLMTLVSSLTSTDESDLAQIKSDRSAPKREVNRSQSSWRSELTRFKARTSTDQKIMGTPSRIDAKIAVFSEE